MKQHIIRDQLNELSEQGKKKLREWSQDLDSDFELTEENDNGLPLLSIGQMIEFLENKFGKGMGIYGYPVNHSPKVPNGGYAIKIIPEENDVGIFGSRDGYLSEGQEELCDALWETVKEILKRQT